MKTEIEKGIDAAVRYLSYRSRTEKEVLDHLLKKKFQEKTIHEIINRLKEYRYLDDQDYLRNYLSANAQVTRYGKIRIYHDLKRRGLKESVLDQLDYYYPRAMEKKFCKLLADKHYPKLSGKSIPERKKKLYAKLLRLGYESIMVLDCIDDLEWENDDQEEDDEEKIRFKIEEDFKKYQQRHTKKGYRDYELNQRIFRNLASRGYSFDLIKQVMDEKKAHLEE